MLVLAGTVAARITLPAEADPIRWWRARRHVDVTEELIGVRQPGERQPARRRARDSTRCTATATVDGEERAPRSTFEAVALTNPDECEVLNNAECLLPYPVVALPGRGRQHGDRLPPATSRPAACPMPNGPPLSPDPVNQLDGFSPTVQILMHFPQGVDLERSDASRLLAPGCCGQPAGPPWIDTRTYDGRSLDADSPSVLLDADDRRARPALARARRATPTATSTRQALIMRPGLSLVPGHRYIVAMRNLHDRRRRAVVAEAGVRRAARQPPDHHRGDRVAPRRRWRTIFAILADDGIARDELVLAFDFARPERAAAHRRDAVDARPGLRLAGRGRGGPAGAITFTVTNVQETRLRRRPTPSSGAT